MAKYALVIGLDQYDHFSNLKSAAKDAEAIAQLLEQHQYHVTRLPRKRVGENQWAIAPDKSLCHTELGTELKSFFRERAKHQEAVLYFAGHGFRVSDALTGEEEGYLATSNAAKEGQNAIAFDSLNKLMSQAELSSLVVMMDCCYAGSLLEEQRSLLQPTQTILSHKQNSCLIAACRDFERAREGKDHGIFTAAILQGLSAEHAVQETITSNDLFGFVERELKTSGQEVIHAGRGSAIALVHYPQPTTPREKSAKSARVFISYRSQPPDSELAEEFYQALKAAGHEVFMAAESIRLGDNWSQRIDRELEQCDYFVLLLSPKSATSEMVTEEVRRAKELRDTRNSGKPGILPIRVDFPLSSPLNYDLRGYLNRIQQREWQSNEDTAQILQEILAILGDRDAPPHDLITLETTTKPLTEQPDAPPSPVAPPELPGGQVDLASLYYVERPPTEANCYETVLNPGALIRIKAPRQMGKTSLMSRILLYAEEQEYLTVPLSFQLADAAIFSNLDKFLRWFCASVGRRLRLPNKLNDYWDEIFGSKDNCTAYLEEYLLPEISQPLVLGLDEVDMVFEHPNIAADFMGLLRAWHESAKTNALWKKLRLVVVHSTEVYIPMNINQSPFNVGLPIELSEFSPEQVLDLAQRHGLNWDEKAVNRLMKMVGGHPFLVRVALYQVARKERTLDELLAIAPTEEGPYGDHLRRHWWNLEQRQEMAEAAKRVVAAAGPVRLEPIQAFQLHSMGIVHLQGNDVMPRCDLYRRYFSDRLNVGRA
ncbi:AAA-like domain-containing protein [Sphaerothrix gracilis]|uniref:AAA-like domain-containing protein n=1 Tax=Sphaerothrix gracilis TaxID=3151835 RepID=UPI0031FE1D2B